MAQALTRDALIRELSALGLYESVKDGAFDALFSAVTKDKTQIAALAAVATANATDLATAVALANANKVAINAIIAALKA